MGEERAAEGVQRQPLHDLGADAVIASLAANQAGRVSRAQLLASGITPDAIRHRLRRGSLIVERPGVYAVGFRAEGDRERWATALLDAGPGSMLSHLAAAAAHRFRLPAPCVVDVTNARRLRSRVGIRLHRREIHPAEIHRLDGLPLTSPAQTLFDLGAVLGPGAHLSAANEAFVIMRRTLTLEDLHLVLERNPGRKGARAFRRLLAAIDPEGREIRSRLEAGLNAFLRRRGYPPWEQNVPLTIGADRIRPDVVWRERRVIVEADGRDPHLAPLTFASDRRRDRRLQVEGWHPVRATWEDLGRGAREFDADLRSLLGL